MRRLTPKARGELAEMHFLLAAAKQGLIVAKPWGDNQPFDFLVGCGRRYLRVQVKSTTQRLGASRFSINCNRPARKGPYTAREIDFIAAYVFPENAWFIIPVRDLGSVGTISVSNRRSSKGRFDRFLEAWHHLVRQ
jgi:hypothetical protein